MEINKTGSVATPAIQTARPLRIRALQTFALLLATAGLILLYLYSLSRDIPLVHAGDLSPAMNFATVRVTGRAVRDAHLIRSGGIVFDVEDGSGVITVIGSRTQADALRAEYRLPRRGDRVQAAGRLSIGAGKESVLRLQAAGQLKLHRVPVAVKEQPPVRLADITAERKGERVAVTGTLKEISLPRPGSDAPCILTLEEEGAERAVVFWDAVIQGLNGNLPMPGARLTICGRVDVYKGAVQIVVQAAEDLQMAEAEK